MSLKDITKFENMTNLSINVYGLTDKNKVQILRVSNIYPMIIGQMTGM